MVRLYLVRHGETIWNTESRYQGWTDIPLSENGEKQAACLAKRFCDIDIDRIYASPLQRAIKTAQAVADIKCLPIETEESFKEINFGEWEGKTVKELQACYGDTYMNFIKNPHLYGFPGDGSLENVTNRVRVGLQKVIDENENKNVMIVSHGGIIRLMIMDLMGFDGSYFTKMWINNTGISIIEIKGDRKLMLTVNDSAHVAYVGKNNSNFLKP